MSQRTKVAELAVDINVIGAAATNAALGAVETKGKSVTRSLQDIAKSSGAVALGFGAIVVGATRMAAEYQTILSRVQLFTASAGEAVKVQQRLVMLAIQTRAPLADVAAIFSRISAVSSELGVSQEQVLRVTRAVANTFRLSGATTAEAAASGQQLAQALGSGRLAGDELKSIMENNLALAQAIAKGFGVSVGELKTMGSEGRLLSKDVFAALLSQADAISARADGMQTGLATGFTTLKTGTQAFLGALDQALGITTAIGTTFDRIGQRLASRDGFLGGILTAIAKMSEAVDMAMYILSFDDDAIARMTPQGRSQLAARASAGANPLFGANGARAGAGGFGNGFGQFALSGVGRLDGFGLGVQRTFQTDNNGAGVAIPGATTRRTGGSRTRTARGFTGESNPMPLGGTFRRGALESIASTIDAARQARMQRARDNVNGMGIPESTIVDTIGRDVTDKLEAIRDRVEPLAQSIGGTFVDALSTGISTAAQSGSLGEGFRALGATLVGGLGRMAVDFGKQSLLLSSAMVKLRTALSTLNPVAGVAASLGIIALGSVMIGLGQRAARSSFSGAGRSDGFSGGGFTLPASTVSQATVFGAPSSIIADGRTPITSTAGSSVTAATPMVVNVFSPDDPVTQRFFREVNRRADGRGSL